MSANGKGGKSGFICDSNFDFSRALKDTKLKFGYAEFIVCGWEVSISFYVWKLLSDIYGLQSEDYMFITYVVVHNNVKVTRSTPVIVWCTFF